MTTPDPICGRHRVQRLCSRTAPRRTQRHFRSARRRCQANEGGLLGQQPSSVCRAQSAAMCSTAWASRKFRVSRSALVRVANTSSSMSRSARSRSASRRSPLFERTMIARRRSDRSRLRSTRPASSSLLRTATRLVASMPSSSARVCCADGPAREGVEAHGALAGAGPAARLPARCAGAFRAPAARRARRTPHSFGHRIRSRSSIDSSPAIALWYINDWQMTIEVTRYP